ncbi:hypothetical protein BV511_03195 [Methylorubrum extorquens]|uniref:hypothetical protein n=1 Tax=Methylorubrum extorquens TaxID=408 RepID=UPI000972BF22|nr:hypothetical protein [Methylorubrum extorquens]APX83820.1 hypothetical protein BV511_03195 [Methylorubrum extorquens]
MNRRSVLRWLGLAPVAAPAAMAAASAPALPPIDYSALTRDVVDHAQRVVAASDAAFTKQVEDVVARINANTEQVRRIISAEQRISAAEGRIGMLVTTAAG